MIIEDKDQLKGWKRKVKVRCFLCRKERMISMNFAKKDSQHICRSCSSKRMIRNHPEKFASSIKAMADGTRKKAREGNGRIQSGYHQIYMPEHPYATGGGRKRLLNGKEYISYNQYVYEHNLVIEQHTGRHPEKHEIVHHINCDKLDNRIENLYLCSGANRKESEQIHNTCHKSAHDLTISLLNRGLVEFIDGEYKTTELFAEIFGV